MSVRLGLAAAVAAAALAAVPVHSSLGAWDDAVSATQDVTTDSVQAALDVDRAADGATPGVYAAQPGSPSTPLVRGATPAGTTTAREARTTTGAVAGLSGAVSADTASATLSESALPPLLLPANRTFDAGSSGWGTTGTTAPATATHVTSGGRDGTGALAVGLTGAAAARSGTAVWSTDFTFANAVPASLTLHYTARVAGASGLTGVNRWRVQLVDGSTTTLLDEVAVPPTAATAPPQQRWAPLPESLLQPDRAYTLRVAADLSLAAGASGGITVVYDDITLDVRATTALLPKNRKFTTADSTTDWTVDWVNKAAPGVNVNQWASSEGSPNDGAGDGVGGMRVSFSNGVTAAEQVVVWQTRVTLAAGTAATFRYDHRYLLGDQLDRVNSRWEWYLIPPSASSAATAATSPLRVAGPAPAALSAYQLDSHAIDPPPFPGTDASCPSGTNYWRHYPGAGAAAPFCTAPGATSMPLGTSRFTETGTYTLAVRVRILALTYGVGATGTANGASIAFDNVVLQLTAGDERLDTALLVPTQARRSAELAVRAATSGETFRVSLLRAGAWVPVLTVSAATPSTQTVPLSVRTDVSGGDVVVRVEDTGGGADATPDSLALDLLTVTGTDPPATADDVDMAFGPHTRATDTGRLARAFVLRSTASSSYTVRLAAGSPLLAYAAVDLGSATGVSGCQSVLTDGVALAHECLLAPGGTLPVDVRVVANGVPGVHVLPVVVTLSRPGSLVDQSAFYRLTVLGALAIT